MAVSYTSQGGSANGTDGTSFNLTVDAGAEDATRQVLAGIMSNGGAGDPSSVTINGITATLLAGYSSGSGQDADYSFWVAAVPTGGSMTVAVTYPNSRTRAHCTIWSVYGADPPTLFDSANSNFSTSASLTIDIDAANHAFVISHIRQTANYYMGYGDDYFASASAAHVIDFGLSSFTGITYRDRIFSEASGTINQGEMFAIALSFPEAAGGDDIPTNITQVALLVAEIPNQPVVATQTPVLVVNAPIQSVRVTQAPILTANEPRPVPLPDFFVPEVPVVETWEWVTALTASRRNYEQRAALRNVPRYRFDLDFTILSDADRSAIQEAILRLMSRSFTMALHHLSSAVTASATIGATKLYFNPAHTDLRDGEQIGVYDPATETTRYLALSTIDVDGCTLAAALASEVRAGELVCPALALRMPNSVGFAMRAIDGAFSGAFETLASRVFQRPGASPTLTYIDGLLVLKERPLADDKVDEDFYQVVNWVDNKVAAPVPITHWDIPYVGGTRTYKANRFTDMDYWRAVGDYTKGSQKPFLLPTFRNDLPLASTPALNATVIVTNNVQYFTHWREAPYRYIQLNTANGLKYRRVLEATANYSGDGDITTVSLTLSASIGNVAGDNDIRQVSYMILSRIADDKIKLTCYELDAIVEIGIKAVAR